jgi:hypothetical protein
LNIFKGCSKPISIVTLRGGCDGRPTLEAPPNVVVSEAHQQCLAAMLADAGKKSSSF